MSVHSTSDEAAIIGLKTKFRRLFIANLLTIVLPLLAYVYLLRAESGGGLTLPGLVIFFFVVPLLFIGYVVAMINVFVLGRYIRQGNTTRTSRYAAGGVLLASVLIVGLPLWLIFLIAINP
jgi:hypothetical protein